MLLIFNDITGWSNSRVDHTRFNGFVRRILKILQTRTKASQYLIRAADAPSEHINLAISTTSWDTTIKCFVMKNIVGSQKLSFVFINIVGYTFIFDFLELPPGAPLTCLESRPSDRPVITTLADSRDPPGQHEPRPEFEHLIGYRRVDNTRIHSARQEARRG
jgi:hypothetical protein